MLGPHATACTLRRGTAHKKFAESKVEEKQPTAEALVFVAEKGGPAAEEGRAVDSGRAKAEVDRALRYVAAVKERLASRPETYRKFLEVVHAYQKRQCGAKGMLDDLLLLFADHTDLLKDFTCFLPDAVQEEAKAQLALALEKIEERARERREVDLLYPATSGCASEPELEEEKAH